MTFPTFMGYRRENGKVGIRNHVAILPLDDLSNAACEAVANNIKGTIALPHAYGRLQFGEDLDLFFRTIIGIGSNPNVAAVVVIGIEPEWTNVIVEGIAKTGKPVTGFPIERNGDLKTIEKASRKAKEYIQWATELQKVPCSVDELYVSVKCPPSCKKYPAPWTNYMYRSNAASPTPHPDWLPTPQWVMPLKNW